MDVAKGETVIKEKEEELYALQEKLVSMENEEIQKLIDDHKATLEARKTKFEAKFEQRQSLCKEREEALTLFEQLKKLKTELNVIEDHLKKIADKDGSHSPRPADALGFSHQALGKNIFGTPVDTSVKVNPEPSSGRIDASSSKTSCLSWLQKCASKIFNQSPSPGKVGDSTVGKEETERSYSPALEIDLGAEVERMTHENIVGEKVEHGSLDDVQNDGLTVEAAQDNRQGPGRVKPWPVVNFDSSLPSPSAGNGHK